MKVLRMISVALLALASLSAACSSDYGNRYHERGSYSSGAFYSDTGDNGGGY